MMTFFKKKSLLNYSLLPIAVVWQIVTARRLKKTGFQLNKSLVICVGNITVGGSGKTPFTIYLAKLLQQQGYKVGLLSRGYKSKLKELTLVDINTHSAKQVGDEALLLSKVAPLVICKNRVKGAEYLEQLGFNIIIMDDGLQNPSLYKDYSILMIDNMNPFGNNLIMPAGPLRESFKSVAHRINWVIGVGKGHQHYIQNLAKGYNIRYGEASVNVVYNNDSIVNNHDNQAITNTAKVIVLENNYTKPKNKIIAHDLLSKDGALINNYRHQIINHSKLQEGDLQGNKVDSAYGKVQNYNLAKPKITKNNINVASESNKVDFIVKTNSSNINLDNIASGINIAIPVVTDTKLNLQNTMSEKTNNTKYLVFAGIGNPAKFFNTLEQNGFKVVITKSFKDHYAYKDKDIIKLISIAQQQKLRLITTSKDYVKINPKFYKDIDELKISLTLPEAITQKMIAEIMYKYKTKQKANLY